ncbi:dynein regulatory complex protein 11 [Bombus vancouverensis nearcticus]|uniref:Dynein regulatory complex protein 11 n=1 Tax=Bombus bifarius TaxID=103933 RepID=A0A6P8LQP7_9HYME|nr:dynein regulatory complex protein 11 [Bombus vancouverensis nearcticus]XP_033303056.1 dynein regulatory complex protein 11 [Bombus bifarius]
MSSMIYNELWKSAQTDMEELLQIDTNLQNAKSQKDRKKAHNTVSELYVRYILIYNKLELCYDQIIQPQKRILMKQLLVSCLGRILELKHELVEIDLSEYSYFDDILIKLSVTPQEVEIQIPRYFRRECLQEIEGKRKYIESILKGIGVLDEVVPPKNMTESEAIRLIQAHERARQGRLRFQFMKEIRQMKNKSAIKADAKIKESCEKTAVIKIQKVWRGYVTRCKIRKRRLEEMLLIGMLQPSQEITENARQAEKVKEERYEKQIKYQELYENLVVEAKERIRKGKSAIIEENIRSEVRNWVNTYFQQTGKIPDLPSAESGGSRVIFSRQGTESTISKSTAVSSKESKKSKRSKSKKDSDVEQSEEETEQGFKSVPSNFLSELVHANQEYQETWKNKDEAVNMAQLPYLDMIENKTIKEVENEVRITVDQALRDDIEALQYALDRDRGLKGKRVKKTQKRIRRSGKKNKKRKEKDLTPDRTTESLFEELLTQGIIKLHKEIPLCNFKGEKSFINYNLREKRKDPLPALGDIRQLIAEYCILPLGNNTLRELTPLIRSVLIAGPHGSGKKMLVNAICTELGATLFDITPANIAGKYPGKSGLIMLMHLILKVSRLLQPSVIFMEGAEKPFVKKVSKTDKTDPKRLKKDLPKLVKSITNEDRVILIGTSSSPWDGDQKLLYQTYDKIIYIPRPDYGSMSLIWKDLIYKHPGINRQFDTSVMAKICDGFTIGTVLASINEVMTTKRIVQLRTHPLTHGELINALSSKDPVFREEEDTFLAWLSKIPISRKKQRALELELQKLEEESEKQQRKGKNFHK